MATLLTCECVKSQPIEDKLSSIYCALYTIAGNGSITLPLSIANGGTGATTPETALSNLGGTTLADVQSDITVSGITPASITVGPNGNLLDVFRWGRATMNAGEATILFPFSDTQGGSFICTPIGAGSGVLYADLSFSGQVKVTSTDGSDTRQFNWIFVDDVT